MPDLAVGGDVVSEMRTADDFQPALLVEQAAGFLLQPVDLATDRADRLWPPPTPAAAALGPALGRAVREGLAAQASQLDADHPAPVLQLVILGHVSDAAAVLALPDLLEVTQPLGDV